MSKVSRSVYQELSEKYKSLLADMQILVMEIDTKKGYEVYKKWLIKFKQEDELNRTLKAVASQYFKDHPEWAFMKRLNIKNN